MNYEDEVPRLGVESYPPFTWWFPKIGDTFLGVPIIRTIIFGSLYWGSPILGKYHI